MRSFGDAGPADQEHGNRQGDAEAEDAHPDDGLGADQFDIPCAGRWSERSELQDD